MPASTTVLAWYAQFLANKMKAHSTVVAYLSGVKTLHVLLDISVSQFSEILLKLTERGPRCRPVDLGALRAQSMLVLMITSGFYVFSTSH